MNLQYLVVSTLLFVSSKIESMNNQQTYCKAQEVSATQRESKYYTLHCSSIEGNLDLIKKYLLGNLDLVNELNEKGNTPLHEAVVAGQLGSCTLLLKWGANMYLKTANGKNAFELAFDNDQVAILKLLQQKKYEVVSPVQAVLNSNSLLASQTASTSDQASKKASTGDLVEKDSVVKDLLPRIATATTALQKVAAVVVKSSQDPKPSAERPLEKIIVSWEPNSVLTLTGHSRPVTSASFTSAGDKLVNASHDNTAKIWDVTTGTCLHTLRGHSSWVNSASFTSAGDKLVTASLDNTAKIWDVTTGTCLYTLSGHSGRVNSASFTGAGDKLVTASADKTAKIWQFEAV